MVDSNVADLEALLRVRLRRFLSLPARWSHHVTSALKTIRDADWAAFLFGGTLRDLVVFGSSYIPRDLDIVIDGITVDTLAMNYGKYLKRRTRFGGLHLEIHGWPFDIWPLAETWAFKHGDFKIVDFSTLPLTTFLNVEAVAIDLRPDTRGRRIHSFGFFESILDRTVEINFLENPFPALCVVRSLIIAEKLRFSAGPLLTRYIAHHGARIDLRELIDVQRSHYGNVRLPASRLIRYINAMDHHAKTTRRAPFNVPAFLASQTHRWRQLMLFGDRPSWGMN
jgi:hypothetical protein